MAGLGTKLWASGEVVTAAGVNGYLQDQVIGTYASTTARDDAFGGAGEPTLAEGMFAYTSDTNTLWLYDGAAWVSAINTASLNGIGTWAAYTPVWSSSGTQPTIGNGSITGRYAVVNKIGFAQVRIAIGSTSTAGTGNYYVSFPVAAGGAATGFGLIAGALQIYDASAGTAYNGTPSYMGNGSTLRAVAYANATQAAITWGQGSPITPATSDEFNFNFVFEVA